MSSKKRALLPVLVFLAGCVPVLVGGLILHSSKSNAEKREFMSRLETTNTERERLGLKSLDVCSEKATYVLSANG